jgi:hypothetical protein
LSHRAALPAARRCGDANPQKGHPMDAISTLAPDGHQPVPNQSAQ